MTWGFIERAHNALNALGSLGEDAAGLVTDIATAPWNDKVNGNPLTVIYDTAVKRGGGVFSDLLGPTGVTGTIAGGLPEIVRRPIRDVVNPVQDGLSVAYRDAISHPVSAALTAGSLADRPGGGGIGGLFHPKTWEQAWQLSQHESPGQAFALAAQTKDILNTTEVAAAKRSDSYRVMSGVSDALVQMVNPLNATLGEAGAAARYTKVGPHLGTIESALTAGVDLNKHPILKKFVVGDPRRQLENLVNSGRVEDYAHRLETRGADGGPMTMGEIHDTYYAKHPMGAQISSLLANAAQTGETVPVTRVLLGRADEIDQIAMRHPELAAEIDRLQAGRAAFEPRKIVNADNAAPWGRDDFGDAIKPSPVTDPFTREIAATKHLYDADTQLSRLESFQGIINQFPTKLTLGAQEARQGLRHAYDDWYQGGRFSTPLHVIHNMNPHAYVNLDDATHTDVQLARMLHRSDLSVEEQQAFRTQMGEAANATDRGAIFDTATNKAIESIANTAGRSELKADEILQRTYAGRKYAQDLLNQKQFDGQGRASVWLRDESGNATQLHLPLWVTQQVNATPVTDMNRVRKALEEPGALGRRFGHVAGIPHEALAAFDQIWRPGVLLTPGGTLRRVGDEIMRSTMKFGILSDLRHLEQGAVNSFRKHFGDETPGTHEMKILGNSLQGPMGAPGDAGAMVRFQNTSAHSVGMMLGKDEEGVMKMLQPTGSWESIAPTDARYSQKVRGMTPWEHAVNRQIGQDVIGKKMLAGQSAEDVYRWLTGTKEGRYYGKQLSYSRKAYLENLRDGEDQIRRYLPTDELKIAALQGKATHAMLDAQVEEAARPIVHGEILDQALGKSQSGLFLHHAVSKMHHVLGTMPYDFLSRNPTYSEFYTREVQRRVLLADSQGQIVNDAVKNQIEQQSKRWALGKTKSLMHDYTERSQLAEMLRFTIPFWGAYWQHAARWAGVIADDPSWVRKMQLVWEAPNKAGWVVDENGNTVNEHGRISEVAKVKGADGKMYAGGGYKIGDKAGSEQFITLTLPSAIARHIPGLRTGEQMKLGKSGINLLAHGLPTFGPLAQLPLNAVAKERPDLAASMKWALPYGPNQSPLSTLFPATAQHFYNASEENGKLFVNTRVRILHDDIADYNLKYKVESPDAKHLAQLWDKSGSQARAFMSMHNAASFVAPTAVLTDSPYEKYIDVYRSRLEYDAKLTDAQRNLPGYQSPKDWFLTTFGPEFFPLTESLSHTNNGVPPTLEAYHAQANDPRLAKLISADPELGNLIIGKDGAGQFNRAVYEYQFAHGVGDQSGLNQRALATPTEARDAPSIALGWTEYSKMADAVTTALAAAGIGNINDKRAQGLRDQRQQWIADLAGKFPAWYEDYSKVDEIANQKRLIALDRISQSKPMMAPARHDMAGLRDYLAMRKEMTGILAQSKFSTIGAKANSALANVWDTAVQALIERNPAFGSLYARWLSRDQIAALSPAGAAYEQAVTIPEVA